MSTLIIGFILVFGVLFGSMEGSASLFLQARSIIVVIGGTFAILLLSNSPAVLRALLVSLKQLVNPDENLLQFQEVLQSLSKDKSRELKGPSHPLITYAADLWSQGIDPDLFIVLVSQKRNEILSRGLDAIQALKNLSKYPPALGMTGTVMGIVNVFYALDQNKDSIGMNLSVAMTATFLGLILANIIISPLADRIFVKQVREERLCESIYQVVLLINRDEPAVLIQGEINERAA